MDVQELIDEGLMLLEIGSYKEALKIGRRIIDARHTYGFEITARAYWGLDKKKKAIRTVEDGLKRVAVWPLLQLRGNYASEDGDFARAYECYERALATPDVDPSLIHLNYAIALRRENRIDDALAHLDLVTEGGARVIAASVRAEIFIDRHQFDEAIAAAKAALDIEVDAKERAYLHVTLADALLEKGSRSEALASAWDAIALERANERGVGSPVAGCCRLPRRLMPMWRLRRSASATGNRQPATRRAERTA